MTNADRVLAGRASSTFNRRLEALLLFATGFGMGGLLTAALFLISY